MWAVCRSHPASGGKSAHLFFVRKTKNHKTAAQNTYTQINKSPAAEQYARSLTRWNSFPRHSSSHSLAVGWILFIKIPLYRHKKLKTIIRFKYLNKHGAALLRRFRTPERCEKQRRHYGGSSEECVRNRSNYCLVLLPWGTLEIGYNPKLLHRLGSMCFLFISSLYH